MQQRKTMISAEPLRAILNFPVDIIQCLGHEIGSGAFHAGKQNLATCEPRLPNET